VRDVRGEGLLVGLELGPTESGGLFSRLMPTVVAAVSKHVFGQWLALRLLEKGILAQPAANQWNVLKLEPALTVTEAEVERVVEAIRSILAQYKDLPPLLADVGQRLGSQFLAGWSF
jgi:putrescine aminotransferase